MAISKLPASITEKVNGQPVEASEWNSATAKENEIIDELNVASTQSQQALDRVAQLSTSKADKTALASTDANVSALQSGKADKTTVEAQGQKLSDLERGITIIQEELSSSYVTYTTTSGVTMQVGMLNVPCSIEVGRSFTVRLIDAQSALTNKGTLYFKYKGQTEYTAIQEIAISSMLAGRTFTATDIITDISFYVRNDRVLSSAQVGLSLIITDNIETQLATLNTIMTQVDLRSQNNASQIDKLSKHQWYKDRTMNIAYSKVTINGEIVAPINSREHFVSASKSGAFNALKADIAVTSDGKLICCHDLGFTFDEFGRVITYSAETNTPINTLTYDFCKELKYAMQVDGQYASVCTIDDFLAICRTYNMIPYLTFRYGEYVDNVSAFSELNNLLVKYSFDTIAIINLFIARALLNSAVSMIRMIAPSLPICYTLQQNKTLRRDDEVDVLIPYGNIIVCFYLSEDSYHLLDSNIATINYARSNSISIYMSQVGSLQAYKDAISRGITGFQLTSDVVNSL